MGLTLVWAIEHEKYGITVNAMAPSGMTRMTGTIPGIDKDNPPPEMNPELNGPLIAFLASEKAAHVNGQIFGRRGFGYTLFQQPRPVAMMYKPGGLTRERDRRQLQRRLPRAPAADRHPGDADARAGAAEEGVSR